VKLRIDTHLRAYLEGTNFPSRPRRNGTARGRNAASGEILANAEAAGDAVRYLDKKGRIAWRATSQLREYLNDLKADAEADAEHGAI
jgi:hypothetical protein